MNTVPGTVEFTIIIHHETGLNQEMRESQVITLGIVLKNIKHFGAKWKTKQSVQSKAWENFPVVQVIDNYQDQEQH